MLSSVIGALGDRMDSKFLTAYWLPSFVFVFGSLCLLGLGVGWEQLEAWITDLDSVEQTLCALIVVLLISMVAFLLRSLSRPVTEVFAGVALPRVVARAFTRGQVRAKRRASYVLGDTAQPCALEADEFAGVWLRNRFPSDDQCLRPTLFGNLLASVSEHPRIAYSMEAALWWPRLSPLLPSFFVDSLAGTQAPMMALLNLSIVFSALATLGLLIALLAKQWVLAIVLCGLLLLCSRLAYRAAVSQAAEVASMLRVAFDLYRYDILDQLGAAKPDSLAKERALWGDLTRELLGIQEPGSG